MRVVPQPWHRSFPPPTPAAPLTCMPMQCMGASCAQTCSFTMRMSSGELWASMSDRSLMHSWAVGSASAANLNASGKAVSCACGSPQVSKTQNHKHCLNHDSCLRNKVSRRLHDANICASCGTNDRASAVDQMCSPIDCICPASLVTQ
jgi:hypothetical protein